MFQRAKTVRCKALSITKNLFTLESHFMKRGQLLISNIDTKLHISALPSLPLETPYTMDDAT